MDVKRIVEKFGGQTALAGLLGIGQSGVAYWVKRGAIPSKWHQKLLELAKEEEVSLSTSDLMKVAHAVAAEQAVSVEVLSADDPSIPTVESPPGSTQFLFYASQNGTVKAQVILGDETVWLSQKGMSDIFGTTRENVTIHLRNVFAEKELDVDAVSKDFLLTGPDGKNYNYKLYNLDAIISIGYRVNSFQATQFRRWATTVLREYLIKGFSLDDERLKQGSRYFGKDYFDELLDRIREIRASERRFYQKITDIYAQCSIDYDKTSPTTIRFYAHVQDKLHYAIHGNTAAELIYKRADATKPYMGLCSYTNQKRRGKVLKGDTAIGKNYLNEDELTELNRIVSMYLDSAETMARRRISMTMAQWADRLDAFLKFNAYDVLENFGRTSREVAEHHAHSEFEKFRVIQDGQFESDFDKVVDTIRTKRKLPSKC